MWRVSSSKGSSRLGSPAQSSALPVRLIACILAGAGVAGPAPTPAPVRFEEIAAKAGLLFELHNGASGQFHQIELTAGGVAVLDYNNDGCADVFFTNGAAIPLLEKSTPKYYNRLYRNLGGMKFQDVTEAAGLAGEGYCHGVAAADYDNDGHVDLFVAGVRSNHLYRTVSPEAGNLWRHGANFWRHGAM